MVEVLSVVLFLLGLILILKGGDLMVESSVWIAEATKIPAMVIGATVVSIATTFPETTVAFIASLSNQEELALNTSVGSMICNFTLVLGLSFALLPTNIDSKAVSSRSIFFAIVLGILLLFSLDLSITLWEAIILLIIFFLFLWFNLRQAKSEKRIITQTKIKNRPHLGFVILQFILSTIAIGYGASVLVSNVKNLSNLLGISEQLIGLSFIALGTNIPEIVTTMASIRKNTPEIGVGNIFGASLINATLLIGGSTLLAIDKEISLQKHLLYLSIPLLFLILFIVSYPIFRKGKSTRIQGFILLFLYFIYSIVMSVLL